MAATSKAVTEPLANSSVDGISHADRIGLVVGGQFVSAIIGLVQGILFVRLLDKSSFGTLSFVLLLYGTGRELGTLSLPESLLYFAPKTPRAQLLGLIRQTMWLLLALGVVVALILGLLSLFPAVFLNGRTDLQGLLLLAGLLAIIGFPGNVYSNVFIATDNHRRAAGISLISTLLGAFANLVPAALGWPVSTILCLTALSLVVRIVLSERLLRIIFSGTTASPFPGGVKGQFAYVMPLSVTRFAGIFNQKLDKFVVGLFFAAESFAEFSIGSQELPLVSILPYTIASTMLPKLVELYEKGATRENGARNAVDLWHAGMRKAAIVMVPVGIFLLLAAEHLMVVMYGEKYRVAAVPFRIYSTLLLVRLTGYGIILLAFGRSKEVMRIQILGMGLNVALSFLLLPRIGMIAAPLGAVLTQIFMIAAILGRVESFTHYGVRGIFPWSHWLRTLGAATLAAAFTYGVTFLGRGFPAPALLILSLIAFAPVYVLFAHIFGVLTQEDRAFIMRWVRLEPFRARPPSTEIPSTSQNNK